MSVEGGDPGKKIGKALIKTLLGLNSAIKREFGSETLSFPLRSSNRGTRVKKMTKTTMKSSAGGQKGRELLKKRWRYLPLLKTDKIEDTRLQEARRIVARQQKRVE